MSQRNVDFSIISMAQLVSFDGKSCVIEAIDNITKTPVLLYFSNGVLVNAKFGSLKGEKASLKIFSHSDQIKILKIYQLNEVFVEYLIDKSIEYLILEASRLKDENKRKYKPQKKQEVSIMEKLQQTQDYLQGEIEGFVVCAVVDVNEGLALAGTVEDPNFDISIPSGYYTATFLSAVKSFESIGWGIPKEVLIPGDTHTVILMSLKNGTYYQGIAFKSKTPLGMVRAIFNKIRPEIEKILP